MQIKKVFTSFRVLFDTNTFLRDYGKEKTKC